MHKHSNTRGASHQLGSAAQHTYATDNFNLLLGPFGEVTCLGDRWLRRQLPLADDFHGSRFHDIVNGCLVLPVFIGHELKNEDLYGNK